MAKQESLFVPILRGIIAYKSTVTGVTYYVETKINPKSGLETLAKLLTRLGVEVRVPLLEDAD